MAVVINYYVSTRCQREAMTGNSDFARRFKRYQLSYIRNPATATTYVSDSLSKLVDVFNVLDTVTHNTKTINRSGWYYAFNHSGTYKGLEVGIASSDGFCPRPGDSMVFVNALIPPLT